MRNEEERDSGESLMVVGNEVMTIRRTLGSGKALLQ